MVPETTATASGFETSLPESIDVETEAVGATAPEQWMTWSLAIAAVGITLVVIRTRCWRFAAEIRPQPLRWPLGAVGIFALMLLTGVVGATLATAGADGSVYRYDGPTDQLTRVDGGGGRSGIEFAARAMLGMVLGQGLVIVVAMVAGGAIGMARGEPDSHLESDPVGVRKASPIAAAVVGLVAMSAAYPLLSTGGRVGLALEAWLRGTEVDPVAHGTLQLLLDSGGLFGSPWSVLILFLVVTGIPLCEEFAYRGLLQRVFAAWFHRGDDHGGVRGRWMAILLASALFSAMHLSALPEVSRVSSLLLLFAVSIVLGWSYERTGRLIAPIAGHALFNAINLMVVSTGST